MRSSFVGTSIYIYIFNILYVGNHCRTIVSYVGFPFAFFLKADRTLSWITVSVNDIAEIVIILNVNKEPFQLTLTCWKSTIETPEKGVNFVQKLIKTLERLQWRRYGAFSGVSIVDFEQVNVSWDKYWDAANMKLIFLRITGILLKLLTWKIIANLFTSSYRYTKEEEKRERSKNVDQFYLYLFVEKSINN